MHKLLFFLFFICISSFSMGQFVYPYQDIKLEKPSDYTETEPLALSAATFLLTTPFTMNDLNRLRALSFLSNWMAGVKDFEIHRRGIFQDIAGDENVTALFIAALVKYRIENKKQLPSPMIIEVNACKMVLVYCDNPVNNYRIKKKLRKFLENN